MSSAPGAGLEAIQEDNRNSSPVVPQGLEQVEKLADTGVASGLRAGPALDPEAFERAFRRFIAAFAKANGIKLTGVVAVDGKAVRGAYERSKSSTPLHMVNVFAAEARMVLASRKAPGRNEAQGALEILQMLSLEGCTVTADALHCSRPFATMVLARGAQFVLALKQNQGKLCDAVERRFARAGKRSVARSIEPSTHDRQESRRATVIRDTMVAAANHFPGVVA